MKSGIYIMSWCPISELYIDWLNAQKINVWEFCCPANEDFEKEKENVKNIQAVTKYAHEKGMGVYTILLTNWVALKGEKPRHICPSEPGNFEKTMAINRHYIKEHRDVDAYEVFAGDPGGCYCPKCSTDTFLKYVKEYYKIIKGVNPKAEVYTNTWAITYWYKPEGKPPPWMDESGYLWDEKGTTVDSYWTAFFNYEDMLSQKIIDVLPSDVHISLPVGRLYRPLALQGHGHEGKMGWPTKATIERLREMGRKVLAWPYFLFDDDKGRPEYWMKVHCNVGYIKKLILRLNRIGVDTVIPGLCTPEYQLATTYAFAELCKNPNLEVTTILKEFSKLIVRDEDVEKLYEILILLENWDQWFGGGTMPEWARIKHPKPKISWREALDLVKQISKLVEKPRMPLIETPEGFLKKLEETIISQL